MPDIIQQIFGPIIGKPCWNVKQGSGSYLTFEFGEPHLLIKEPAAASIQTPDKARRALARRHVHVQGDWHFWVYSCDWKIISQDEELANQDSAEEVIRSAIRELDGQALSAARVMPSLVSVFDFDLGGRLEIIPNHDKFELYDELWFLYEPSGDVFTLRAYGQWRHKPGDTPAEEYEWKPLEI